MPTDVSFVRKHFVEQQEPPARERGVVKWIRENLFYAQPDGPCHRVHPAFDAVLPDRELEHLGDHERLPQIRSFEGALI